MRMLVGKSGSHLLLTVENVSGTICNHNVTVQRLIPYLNNNFAL